MEVVDTANQAIKENNQEIKIGEVNTHLLKGIQRTEMRKETGIDKLKGGEGVDILRAYDFSYLDKKNYRVRGAVKIVYDAHTPKALELKALKKYLNTYASVQFKSIEEVIAKLTEDLNTTTDGTCLVGVIKAKGPHAKYPTGYKVLRSSAVRGGKEIELLPFDGTRLSTEKLVKENAPAEIKTSSLIFPCFSTRGRIDGNKDLACVYIKVTSKLQLDHDQLIRYLSRYGFLNVHREDGCELIHADLAEALKRPDFIQVIGFYTRKYGIDMVTIRASQKSGEYKVEVPDDLYSSKTLGFRTVFQ